PALPRLAAAAWAASARGNSCPSRIPPFPQATAPSRHICPRCRPLCPPVECLARVLVFGRLGVEVPAVSLLGGCSPGGVHGALVGKESDMLTIREPRSATHGARITRRSFLRVGALPLSGLTLGDVLRLRAEAPGPGKPGQKSVIMIHLSGGPSHLDTYDMKPGAPSEYRGEFCPIKTNVPGMEICDLLPAQARIADKFAILRGVQLAHLHTANEFYSGFPWQDSPRASVPGEAQRPALGSVVSRLRGVSSGIPPYVSLNNRADWERAYSPGVEHEPFRAGGGNFREPLDNLSRCRDVSVQRLDDRKELLHAFDTLRRDLDSKRTIEGLDAFQARALEMVTSGRVRAAFDLNREPDKVRTRFGERPFAVVNQECGVIKHHQVTHPGQALLQARRLVE